MPAPNEADMRMADIQVAYDVCTETQSCCRGARRRVAKKHGICPSTVTECIKRVDRALGTRLFDAVDEGRLRDLTPAGEAYVEAAAMFLRSYQVLRRQVQRAMDGV